MQEGLQQPADSDSEGPPETPVNDPIYNDDTEDDEPELESELAWLRRVLACGASQDRADVAAELLATVSRLGMRVTEPGFGSPTVLPAKIIARLEDAEGTRLQPLHGLVQPFARQTLMSSVLTVTCLDSPYDSLPHA